jgi:hypothetical protein
MCKGHNIYEMTMNVTCLVERDGAWFSIYEHVSVISDVTSHKNINLYS